MSTIKTQTFTLSQGKDVYNISTNNTSQDFQVSIGEMNQSTPPLTLLEITEDGNTIIAGGLTTNGSTTINGNLIVPPEYYINGKIQTAIFDESGHRFENYYTNSQELAIILAEIYNELNN